MLLQRWGDIICATSLTSPKCFPLVVLSSLCFGFWGTNWAPKIVWYNNNNNNNNNNNKPYIFHKIYFISYWQVFEVIKRWKICTIWRETRVRVWGNQYMHMLPILKVQRRFSNGRRVLSHSCPCNLWVFLFQCSHSYQGKQLKHK